MNSFSDEFYFIRVFINLWFSIWKAEVSLSWKSLYKSFPPKGTRTANMGKLIKHKALPFIWNRSGSKGKLCRADIHINHWRTSSRLHFRGSGNKNRIEIVFWYATLTCDLLFLTKKIRFTHSNFSLGIEKDPNNTLVITVFPHLIMNIEKKDLAVQSRLWVWKFISKMLCNGMRVVMNSTR